MPEQLSPEMKAAAAEFAEALNAVADVGERLAAQTRAWRGALQKREATAGELREAAMAVAEEIRRAGDTGVVLADKARAWLALVPKDS
jgi:hypothetical protein